jgi:hypothetical protein
MEVETSLQPNRPLPIAVTYLPLLLFSSLPKDYCMGRGGPNTPPWSMVVFFFFLFLLIFKVPGWVGRRTLAGNQVQHPVALS